MRFTNEHSEDGVTERGFELTVGGNRVPGVLWTPEGARGARPTLLVGHGGGLHKRAPPMLGAARRYAKTLGCAVVILDAPDHGERVTPAEAPAFAARSREQIARSGGMRGEALDAAMARAAVMAPEWRAALDAVESLDFVGALGPVGYAGVSMGALMGIPFVAQEPRVRAAVFGLAGIQSVDDVLARAARQITIPLEFTVQWDDEFVPRADALSLFAAFGSREKTLHANPGGHVQVPGFERAGWEAFFRRHFADVRA